METPPRLSHRLNFGLVNPIPVTNFEQKFSTPPHHRSATDTPDFSTSTKKNIDSIFTTPKTMECTPERNIQHGSFVGLNKKF